MKIIDLDIDAFLSGDTKIEEIGLVFNPAIEVDWVYFNSQEQQFESYDDYPQAARDNACRAVRYAEENGWGSCGTDVGKQRAHQICNGEKISEETIARMASFARHRQHKDVPYDEGCGGLMWDAWSGTEGIEWAQRKLEQIREEKLSSQCGCSIEDKKFNEDEEMIEGIVDLLLKVEDMENRAKMALEVLEDFQEQGVEVDYDLFLERIGLGGPDLAYLWDDVMELEDLLEMGYEITHYREVDPQQIMDEYKDEFNKKEITEEQFYRLTSKPNEPSIMDSPFRLRRYVYAIGPQGGPDLIPTSREFCRRMMGKRQLVWRFEDINLLSAQLNAEDRDYKIIPRPKGASVNTWLYLGGANCRHRWIELSLDPGSRVANNKQKAGKDAIISMDAPGQAGKVNEGVQYGRTRNPDTLREESMAQKDLPIGFMDGVPVYSNKEEAQGKSIAMGCEGVYEKVEYLKGEAFRPCRARNRNEFTSQEFEFRLDDEKRIIYAPAMVPNKLIRRYEPGEGEYFVRFSKEAIERGAHKFLAEGRTTPEFVNYEHTDKKFDDIYLVESWIVGSEEDKIYQFGYDRDQVPEGSWIVGYKVDNDELWEDYVKKGLVKAVSVEGLFDMSFNRTQSDEYLLSEVINILNQID